MNGSADKKKQKPEITGEDDEPLFVKEVSPGAEISSEKEMPSHTVDEIERNLKVAKGWQTILLKDKGFWLLILCIVLAAGIYIAEIKRNFPPAASAAEREIFSISSD